MHYVMHAIANNINFYPLKDFKIAEEGSLDFIYANKLLLDLNITSDKLIPHYIEDIPINAEDHSFVENIGGFKFRKSKHQINCIGIIRSSIVHNSPEDKELFGKLYLFIYPGDLVYFIHNGVFIISP